MQEEIINLLKKCDKPLRRTEIAKALGSTPTKVSMALRQLLKYKEVQFYECDHWTALDVYGSKRRLRLYYVDKE